MKNKSTFILLTPFVLLLVISYMKAILLATSNTQCLYITGICICFAIILCICMAQK